MDSEEVSEDIIDMEDVMAVFAITDQFSIDRETISIPLEKVGVGEVNLIQGGLEVVLPSSITITEWLQVLKIELEQLGFVLQQEEEDNWD